jgi:hypothetical protein
MKGAGRLAKGIQPRFAALIGTMQQKLQKLLLLCQFQARFK